ncbi:DUF2577 family protein [Psychrobacillus sp. OK032]|uniref:DUF2577 family protein n=1 Tax=Psychrobacillus sp. OK032 TaxID=1884358 RepID=UPI0008AAD5FD|nr:DUF2577 family protein [Psychrobacillus sp. OK032]SER87222.1 Protein of unknown function [Psychrobacillus sp. OK032]
MRTHIAKVTSVSPFAIRIEGDADDIEMDSLVIMQSILPHERKADVKGTATFNGVTGAFSGVDMQITFKDGYVAVDDEVFVLETNDGQLYHVIDKVVR